MKLVKDSTGCMNYKILLASCEYAFETSLNVIVFKFQQFLTNFNEKSTGNTSKRSGKDLVEKEDLDKNQSKTSRKNLMLLYFFLLLLIILSGFVSVYWIRIETQLDEVNEKLEDVLYMIENTKESITHTNGRSQLVLNNIKCGSIIIFEIELIYIF